MYENHVICYIIELAMRSSAWLTSLSLPRSPDVVQPNSGVGAQQAPGYKSLCAFCIAARALVVFSYVFGVVAVILSYYYTCGSIGSGLLPFAWLVPGGGILLLSTGWYWWLPSCGSCSQAGSDPPIHFVFCGGGDLLFSWCFCCHRK